MKEYQIITDLFTKSDCYRSTKKCARTGIQVHSVGCKGTLMARWKKSWNRPGRDVCADYVIDTDAIYQILPEGKRCWLSGSGKNGNANNSCLGFEICEPLTKNDTPEVAADLYGKTLYLCTYLCQKFGIDPANVKAHYELHAMGMASNHADVRHWWGKKGTSWEPYTMDTLRRDIAAELGAGSAPNEGGTTMQATVSKGSNGDTVKELQTALTALGYPLVIDGDFGAKTEAALIAYQNANGLKTDGVCGSATWTTINAALGKVEDSTTEDTDVDPEIPTLEQRVETLEAGCRAAGIIK